MNSTDDCPRCRAMRVALEEILELEDEGVEYCGMGSILDIAQDIAREGLAALSSPGSPREDGALSPQRSTDPDHN